ncbi:MAG: xyloglucanase [Thermoguttaceae bacterium]
MNRRVWMRPILCAAGLAAALMPAAASGQQADISSQPYVWKNVKVVAGGFIPGIVFNTKQPGLAYCRTDIGSAYKWDNQTRRWLPLTDWNPVSNLQGSESVATDPIDPNRVYLAQGMGEGQPAAIMRSMDQGKTFQVIDVPFRMGGNSAGRGVGERLAIDPNDNNILYFSSRRDGLWVSKDAASTWTKVNSFPAPAPAPGGGGGGGGRGPGGRGGGAGLSFVVFDPGTGTPGKPTRTIYVGSTDRGGDAHLFRSSDAGLTWQPVPGQPTKFAPIHADFDIEGALYLVYDNGVGPGGVTDGAVWKLNPKDGAWTDITPAKDPKRPPGGYGGMGIDRQHPGTLVVASLNRKVNDDDDRIYRTTDGGKTWKDISPKSHRDSSAAPYVPWVGKPIGNAPVHPEASVGWWIATLAIDPFDSQHVCYATGATIWNTTDMGNADADRDTHWSIWAEGIEETAILGIVSPPAGAHLVSAFGDIGGFTHDDLDVSPRDGIHLHPLFTNTSSLDFAEMNPNVVVRTGSRALHVPDRDTMAYSLDGGHTWKPFMVGAAAVAGRGRGGSIILSADGSVFMSTASPPQISTDHGATWTPVKGLPQALRPVADRANPVRFYALDQTAGKMYRSLDKGATFTGSDVTGLSAGGGRGGFGGRGGGSRLMAVPAREGDLWLVGRGLYHSTDGGASFRPIANAPAIGQMSFGKAAPGKDYPSIFAVFSGNRRGIFRSDDMAATWVRINDSQNQWGNRYTCIAGDPRIYGRVYVGTDGRGIFYGDIAK